MSITPLSKAILTGGKFQDSAGNPLSLGYLLFTLNHDGDATLLGAPTGSQVIAGVRVKFPLDMNGSVTSNSGIWTNDVLQPTGSFYTVTAFNSSGLEVWASPQIFMFTYAPNIDLGTQIPILP
jgi:hypothetical protein